MGQKFSLSELKNVIESDLVSDLGIRYLFSLSTNIKQESNQACCKLNVKYIPEKYEFDIGETESTVVIKAISKKYFDNSP